MTRQTDGQQVYRWTLAEYILRIELGSDIREIVVEGTVDRDLIDRVMREWGCTVAVREGDFIRVEREEVTAAGFRPGMKGRLLTLATSLESSRSAAELATRIAIVVDRDYDPDPPPSRFIFLTDGYAIENYALEANSLHRFVEQVLGRTPRPIGASGASPERHSCSGSDLYARLHGSLADLAGVRLALREADPPMKPFGRWLDYVKLDSTGQTKVDAAALLRNVLITAGRESELDGLETIRLTECAKAHGEPQRWVRARDFLEVLTKILRSPWGRQRNGDVVAAGDHTQLARFLLFSIDPQELISTDLFRALRGRFCAT